MLHAHGSSREVGSLEIFRCLKTDAPVWTDWSKIEPLAYLGAFLEVIRSPETSGPITGVALTSIRRLLERQLFGDYLNTLEDMLHVAVRSLWGS